jgi:hypothetical protein
VPRERARRSLRAPDAPSCLPACRTPPHRRCSTARAAAAAAAAAAAQAAAEWARRKLMLRRSAGVATRRHGRSAAARACAPGRGGRAADVALRRFLLRPSLPAPPSPGRRRVRALWRTPHGDAVGVAVAVRVFALHRGQHSVVSCHHTTVGLVRRPLLLGAVSHGRARAGGRCGGTRRHRSCSC